MGLDNKPSIRKYWSSSKCMPLNRFKLILSCIHFANNEKVDESDNLRKLGNLPDYLNDKFSKMFIDGVDNLGFVSTYPINAINMALNFSSSAYFMGIRRRK